jgi:hypothetical protein
METDYDRSIADAAWGERKEETLLARNCVKVSHNATRSQQSQDSFSGSLKRRDHENLLKREAGVLNGGEGTP